MCLSIPSDHPTAKSLGDPHHKPTKTGTLPMDKAREQAPSAAARACHGFFLSRRWPWCWRMGSAGVVEG